VINELQIQSLHEDSNGTFKNACDILSSDHIDFIQNLAYRYDQLEARDNSAFSKKMFGVDV